VKRKIWGPTTRFPEESEIFKPKFKFRCRNSLLPKMAVAYTHAVASNPLTNCRLLRVLVLVMPVDDEPYAVFTLNGCVSEMMMAC
jgi:hypothetical protein